MRSALGFIIVLWGLSHFFSQASKALEEAIIASFKTVEIAASVAQTNLTKIK